jgi:hypothetical protein
MAKKPPGKVTKKMRDEWIEKTVVPRIARSLKRHAGKTWAARGIPGLSVVIIPPCDPGPEGICRAPPFREVEIFFT